MISTRVTTHSEARSVATATGNHRQLTVAPERKSQSRTGRMRGRTEA